ncbi:MAG TPA: carboxymuconolactone decarboxylase family protein [Planctomycetota bacterium]|nr:carboxymuconolactone decarboxylase family protein [Planctomycetota bacterium]
MPEKTPWFFDQSPLAAGYLHFSNTASRGTVLETKTKELIRLAVASVFRCRHCTEHHIKDAIAAGATTQEVTEALLLSALQAAGTQLNWHREFFQETLTENKSAPEKPL